MGSFPDSGWFRALHDMKPAGALVLAIGLALCVLVLDLEGLGVFWGAAARLGLLLGALACLVSPVNWLFERLGKWRSVRRAAKRHREVLAHLNLNDLGLEEIKILAGCLSRKEPVFYAYANNSGASSLRQKGLATLALSSGGLDSSAYIVPDFVWRELKRHSEEIIGMAQTIHGLQSTRR